MFFCTLSTPSFKLGQTCVSPFVATSATVTPPSLEVALVQFSELSCSNLSTVVRCGVDYSIWFGKLRDTLLISRFNVITVMMLHSISDTDRQQSRGVKTHNRDCLATAVWCHPHTRTLRKWKGLWNTSSTDRSTKQQNASFLNAH